MANKNIVTEKPKEISNEERSKMDELFGFLPKDSFVGIPDDNIVYIGLSGAFTQQIGHVQSFIKSLFKEDDFERFILELATDKLKERDCSDIEKCYIILRELLFEIGYQADGQSKNAIYSKQNIAEFMENIDNVNSEDININPLTFEELKEMSAKENANEG